MGETRQRYEFVPFPLFLSFVQVVLFLADMGRRRRCDTPTMPPLVPDGGRRWVEREEKGRLSRGAATSRCHSPSGSMQRDRNTRWQTKKPLSVGFTCAL